MHPEFSLSPEIAYLNHAAVAPWPRRTAAAVSDFAAENATLGATRYPHWLRREQALRELLARLINAPSPDDIALLKNTSEALSTIAAGLPWAPGDNVVGIAQEFPSNRMVWESLDTRGVQLRLLDLYASPTPEQDLIGLCDGNTRLLSVSSVQYARGLRLDLEPIGAFCRDRGILFCVDAIQSLGALPFDVQRCHADFVVADGHKWMLGAEGLALFYCREEVRAGLRPTQFGWHMVEHTGDFERRDWAPAATARRYECGSPNMLGVFALHASLSLLHEVGLEKIAMEVLKNTRLLFDLIKENEFVPLTPADPERQAGIVTFQIPGRDSGAVQRYLMERKVICAHRGGGIRFSPHFYTDPDRFPRVFELLRRFLA